MLVLSQRQGICPGRLTQAIELDAQDRQYVDCKNLAIHDPKICTDTLISAVPSNTSYTNAAGRRQRISDVFK